MPYWVFLVALFIVGLGFAMLQIAANPYVTILGPERTASSRLNLAQAFNSVGTTIGPLIGGYLIFPILCQNRRARRGIGQGSLPRFLHRLLGPRRDIFSSSTCRTLARAKSSAGMGALKYPHVVLGVLAIFMYVGGEVSIGSSIINFLGQPDVAAMTRSRPANTFRCSGAAC